MKPPKETRRVEGRGRPEDGLSERTEDRTQSRSLLPSALARVHEAASRDKKARFTALLHHVNVEALGRAFGRLKRGAAAGVDGETVATYEQGLSEKLQALCDRVHRGRSRPEPVRRVYIPKSDGGQRPCKVQKCSYAARQYSCVRANPQCQGCRRCQRCRGALPAIARRHEIRAARGRTGSRARGRGFRASRSRDRYAPSSIPPAIFRSVQQINDAHSGVARLKHAIEGHQLGVDRLREGGQVVIGPQ
jgi:hypothetical protein